MMKKLLPHLAAYAALFFLLPSVTGLNSPIELAVTILLVVNPAACLAAGSLYVLFCMMGLSLGKSLNHEGKTRRTG